MKSERTEMAALGAVVGPVFTPQEIDTQRYLADLDATTRHVNALPDDEKFERGQYALERCKAVLDGNVTPRDAEAVRAAFWNRTPVAARIVALLAEHLASETVAPRMGEKKTAEQIVERGRLLIDVERRARAPLADLDAFERGQVWRALERLMGDLQNLQRCMNGGKMPPTPGAAVAGNRGTLIGAAECAH